MPCSRRRFLSTLASACLIPNIELLGRDQIPIALSGGRLIRTMPLGRFDGRPAPPLGSLLGTGLDARQFTDLSTLTADALVTPAEQFFVRTASSPLHGRFDTWKIAIGGHVRRPIDLSLADLTPLVRPMGTHVIECAGNSDPANYGLMSAARWSGVPILEILDRAGPLQGATLVRVTGLDDDSRAWQTSVAGASWIFSRDDLERAGAFLATAMNDADLMPDHGLPVRLVVPNWYGCTAIKWVTSIDVVGDDEPPTGQMREFAARTHQEGMPALAQEFEPAVIDAAALPIRVEKWAADGRIVYRVVGIRWGGSAPACALTIRFRHTEPFVAVDDCPTRASATTWSLWSHVWRPRQPGRYQIVLGVADRRIRARRLDIFYYTREVEIDEETA